jgi:hypothetical protein
MRVEKEERQPFDEKIRAVANPKIPLGTKGRTSILSVESSASCGASFPVGGEKTDRPKMFRHFVPSKELHSLATLARLSLVDLPSANGLKTVRRQQV